MKRAYAFSVACLFCVFAVAAAITDVESASLDMRWQALVANCSFAGNREFSLNEVLLPTAIAALKTLALDRASRSQWLHDVGEWNLLYGGNITRAEEFLRASADLGNPHAQFLVGALVATAKHSSQPEATLFYRFASIGGLPQTSMAMGYRHLIGYGAPRSCETALRHYKAAADDVMRHKHALPNSDLPIQVFSIPPPARLSDDQTKRPRTVDDEIRQAEFLRHRAAMSRNTNLLERTASLILFSDLYQTRTVNHRQAQHEAIEILQRAVSLGSNSAMALLGHVFAYGLAGMDPDISKAIQFYETALNASNTTNGFRFGRSEAANGLGRLYLHGTKGVPADVERAMSYFQVASRAGHAEGVFHSATVMAHANPVKSVELLQASADVGHVGALFELARVKEKARFRNFHQMSCTDAVKLYKQVAEHSPFGRLLLTRATELFLFGHHETALRLYLIGAEMGYEVAEHNAMWLMERSVFTSRTDIVTDQLYSALFGRSAAQGSVDGVVRAGNDAYMKGNYRQAMQQYLRAIDLDPTHAMALYYAGFMCEHGLGTVTSRKSLLRARWYYQQALLHEPLLAYVFHLVVFKIDAKLKLSKWIECVSSWIRFVYQLVVGQLSLASQVTEKTSITQATITPSDVDKRQLRFEPAMEFNGLTSSITVKCALPPSTEGLTLETWMWIDQPSRADQGAEMVLFDWQDTLQIVLTPHKDGSSWQLRVRSGDPEHASVLTLTSVALKSQKWNHVSITVNAKERSTHLVVNNELTDAGNLLVSIHSRPEHLFSVGAPALTAFGGAVFHGKLLAYRLWTRTAIRGEGTVASRSYKWFDLGFRVFPSVDDSTGQESDHSDVVNLQGADSVSLTANDVTLRMIQFPFRRKI